MPFPIRLWLLTPDHRRLSIKVALACCTRLVFSVAAPFRPKIEIMRIRTELEFKRGLFLFVASVINKIG